MAEVPACRPSRTSSMAPASGCEPMSRTYPSSRGSTCGTGVGARTAAVGCEPSHALSPVARIRNEPSQRFHKSPLHYQARLIAGIVHDNVVRSMNGRRTTHQQRGEALKMAKLWLLRELRGSAWLDGNRQLRHNDQTPQPGPATRFRERRRAGNRGVTRRPTVVARRLPCDECRGR